MNDSSWEMSRDNNGMDKREAIILVHGTGAATRNDEKPHWWQAESNFAKWLSDRMGDDYEIVEFPSWGGANSEASRRSGAKLFAKFIDKYERDERSYHVVAHSHGGSVVWHALQTSNLSNHSFKFLRSWTSVGTPFLSMRPTFDQFWPVAALAVLLGLLYSISSSSMPRPGDTRVLYYEWVSGKYSAFEILALSLVSMTFLMLTGWCLWRTIRVTLTAVRRLVQRFRSKIPPPLEVWLGIWHRDDEPIGGLRATMGPPQLLTPRPIRGRENIVIGIGAWLFERCIARPLDELAWSSIMRWLQGADVFGESLVEVSESPSQAAIAWSPLVDCISEEMRGSVAIEAGNMANRIRSSFQRIGSLDSNARKEYLASLINWRAVLHTSYFDQVGIRKIIAYHISTKSKSTTGSACCDSGNELTGIFPERLDPTPTVSLKMRHRFSILAVSAIAAVSISGMVLAQSYARLYDMIVWPSTRQAQIDEIGKDIREGIVTAVKHSEAAGDVIVRYKLIDGTLNVSSVLQGTADANTAIIALEKLAYAAGRLGVADQLPYLEAIADLVEEGEGTSVGIGRTAVEFYQWAGMVDSNDLSNATSAPSVDRVKILLENERSLTPLVVSYFAKTDDQKVAIDLVSSIGDADCNAVEGLAEFDFLEETLADNFSDCQNSVSRDPNDLLRRAIHLATAGQMSNALTAFSEFTSQESDAGKRRALLLTLDLFALVRDGGPLRQAILDHWRQLTDHKNLDLGMYEPKGDYLQDAGIVAKIAIALGNEKRVKAAADKSLKTAAMLAAGDSEQINEKVDHLLDAASMYEVLGMNEKALAVTSELLPILRDVKKPDSTIFRQAMALSHITERLDLDASITALFLAEREAITNPKSGSLELTQLAKRWAEVGLFPWALRSARRAGFNTDGERHPSPGVVEEGTLGGYAAILDVIIRETDERTYAGMGFDYNSYPISYQEWPIFVGIYPGIVPQSYD